MFRRILKSIFPFAVFAACLAFGYMPRSAVPALAQAGKAIGLYGYSSIVNGIWIAVPILALTIRRVSLKSALSDLGILTNPLRPFLFAFIATSPALIGFALTAHVDHLITPRAFFVLCIWSPFAEEVLFRAFAFGQLYRRAGWNFWVATLVPTIFFAAAHAFQPSDAGELAGILAITALGSVLFSYFFVRLGWTIWAPFALHALLNTWWTVFTTNQTALGGLSDNIFRFGSIGLALGLAAAASFTPALRFLVPEKGAWRAA